MVNRIALYAFFFIAWAFVCCGAPASNKNDVASATNDTFVVKNLQADKLERNYERPEAEPQPHPKPMSVGQLLVSAAVEAQSNKAINPQTSFRSGVKSIFASFDIKGFHEGSTIRVIFYRDEDIIEERDIEKQADGRYAAELKEPRGLATGDYSVEVEVEGEMYAKRTFAVGNVDAGPSLDRAALGTELKNGGMPRNEKTVFRRGGGAIKCGVKFLDLPENSRITFNWVSLADEGEEIVNTSETVVKAGGNGTTGASWNPSGSVSTGRYKVEILVDEIKMAELVFTVK
jgi:hypothetical protein